MGLSGVIMNGFKKKKERNLISLGSSKLHFSLATVLDQSGKNQTKTPKDQSKDRLRQFALCKEEAVKRAC